LDLLSISQKFTNIKVEIVSDEIEDSNCKTSEAFRLKYSSLYLDWYIHVPKIKYDFRSSGLNYFKHNLTLGEVDLSINYPNSNPEAAELLAQRYHVQPKNAFVSSEGTTGQNTRIIRYLAEKNKQKNEAIVEYPTTSHYCDRHKSIFQM